MNDEYSFCSNPSGSQASSLALAPKDIDRLATLAKAIAHPARVQILEILARRTACVCGDIVGEMSLAQSTVSEHLRILKAAGLIMGEVDGPRVCYCINAKTFNQFKVLVRAMPCPEAMSLPPTCQED